MLVKQTTVRIAAAIAGVPAYDVLRALGTTDCYPCGWFVTGELTAELCYPTGAVVAAVEQLAKEGLVSQAALRRLVGSIPR